jgi:uncharacterized protein YjeT (DUF2065 family)
MTDFPAAQTLTDDEVDRALSEVLGGADVAALSWAVAALAPEAVLDEELASRHLAVLRLAAQPAHPAPAGARITSRSRLRRSGAAAAGAGLAITVFAGVGVAAAAQARPGDLLYPLKTAREHVVLALASPGPERARLHLRFAQARLAEAAALLRDGRTRAGLAALADADSELAAAQAQGSADTAQAMADALNRRVAVLEGLLAGGLPAHAADAARAALARALGHGSASGPPATRPARRPTPSRAPVPHGPQSPATTPPTHPSTPATREPATGRPGGSAAPKAHPAPSRQPAPPAGTGRGGSAR